MKTAVFDLETFTLHADTGILLCAVVHHYDSTEVPVILRADEFRGWAKRRSNNKPICQALIRELRDYDIFIAHNGVRFDRAMLTSWALKYNLPLFLRFAKFIDPVMLCRKHLRLSRNSLAAVLDFLDVDEEKTEIKWEHWRRATYDGCKNSMDYIVEHCVADVMALEAAHKKMRKLVKDINERGSAW